MSYCRWSSDNYGCDIYAYESCDGSYMLHIASNRVIGDVPKLAPIAADPDEFVASYERQMAFLKTAKRAPIGLPFDGKTFSFDTAQEMADCMVDLRKLGYRMPDYAIEDLREEALAE